MREDGRQPTEVEFLAGFGRESEAEEGQGRDKHRGEDEVEAVVEGPAADADREGDVIIRLGTALVVEDRPLRG